MTARAAKRMDAALEDLLSADAGTVHSVYRSSVNLRMNNGVLCTLLNPADDLGPNGIVLSAAVEFAAPELGLRRGVPVVVREKTVLAGALTVDWTGADRISCAVTPCTRPPGPAVLRSGAARVETLLRDRKPSSAGSALQEALNERTRFLQEAALQTPERLSCAAGSLIGLGMGLTPSGDDFLTGCLAALWCAGGADDPAVGTLRRAVAHTEGLTTDVGGAMLSAAADGRFRTSLLALIGALFQPAGADERTWEETADRVVHYGASSGWDMLSGVEAGCRILLARG